MTGKCMPALDFTGSRLLEPLGRALMGLQLWHKNVFGDPRRAVELGRATTFTRIPHMRS